MAKQIWLASRPIAAVVLLFLCISSSSSKSSNRTTVHIIFMNHLDVGYNTGDARTKGYAINVLNRYFNEHYPQAIKLANLMRDAGFDQKFRYTTHPWLLDLYLNCPKLKLVGTELDCPNSIELKAMHEAIAKGDIIWHAGPMNMQLENMNAVLLEASLNISRRLDEKFKINKPIRVLSQRDVPGMSSAVIPVLKRNDIRAVSVGVNAGSYPPEVTREPFLWQDAYTKESIIAIWHPQGYPNNAGSSPDKPGGLSVRDCSMLSGVPHILCFSFRTDNTGPPLSVDEVLRTYEILAAEFPGAQLIASTLEDFVSEVMPYQSLMQVVKTEIGDTWIQGIASDPRKMSEYRALSRAFTSCYMEGNCPATDAAVQNSVRYIVKLPEHTYGLYFQPDNVNYKNSKFHSARSGALYAENDAAWEEQRQFTLLAKSAVAGHQLQSYIKRELDAAKAPYRINLSGYSPQSLNPGQNLSCNGYEFSFDFDGSLSRFARKGGQDFASPYQKLVKFVYRSYDETDDHKLLSSYGNPGYGKPNVTANAHPISKRWGAKVVRFYQRIDKSSFFLELQMKESEAVKEYGAPQAVYLNYTFVQDRLDVELLLWNKTSTRLEEATFLEFMPRMQTSNCSWLLQKVEKLVDPLRVTYGGSVLQHAVNDKVLLQCTNQQKRMSTLSLQSIDVPLACPFSKYKEASPFPYLDRLDRVDGVSFNIHNNVWMTNYIYWYPFNNEDLNFKARFSLKIY